MGLTYFNPGCALSLYRPEAELKILDYLNREYGEVRLHKLCCRHNPQVEPGSTIINVCAGCDRRFRTLYPGVSTISLWEVLESLGTFPFPDYHGVAVTVHDACPVRDQPRVHEAVRALLRRMNFAITEAPAHGTHSVCCGDSFYPALPVEQIHEAMKRRADSMPCDEVAVYCVSCIKAMHLGGKTPRHLVDLLFGEPTVAEPTDTLLWHHELERYIDEH